MRSTLLLSLLVSTPAHASCDCVSGIFSELLTPQDGATNVPRNTKIWLVSEAVDLVVSGLYVVLDPPADLQATIDTSFTAGNIGPIILEFDGLLPAGTVVSARTHLGATWTTFTVGDWLDETAPSWAGGYNSESNRQSFCGPAGDDQITLHIVLQGVTDDSRASVVAWARPRSKYGKEAWTGDDEFWISNSVCGLGEPTLADDPNRTYDIELFDAAGNHSGEVGKVRTGPGCDSSGAGVSPAWLGVMGLLCLHRIGRRRGAAR